MLASLTLAAALVCQSPTFPGMPGVIGGPIPIPPGATPAEVVRIQNLNRQLHNPAAARMMFNSGIRQTDQGPRVDFLPFGATLVTPKIPPIQALGQSYGVRTTPIGGVTAAPANGVYVNAFGQQLLPYHQPASMVGPPYFGVRNPIPAGF